MGFSWMCPDKRRCNEYIFRANVQFIFKLLFEQKIWIFDTFSISIRDNSVRIIERFDLILQQLNKLKELCTSLGLRWESRKWKLGWLSFLLWKDWYNSANNINMFSVNPTIIKNVSVKMTTKFRVTS